MAMISHVGAIAEWALDLDLEGDEDMEAEEDQEAMGLFKLVQSSNRT